MSTRAPSPPERAGDSPDSPGSPKPPGLSGPSGYIDDMLVDAGEDEASEPRDARPPTARALAKAQRRREILVAAARLMARHGFHGVRLSDIGTEVGVSGPALYRHFASKDEALAEMLLDISQRLHAGARAAMAAGDDPETTLNALIGVHVDFVVTEPDLISVQFQDLRSLASEPRERVRALQREYVGWWVSTLRELRPELAEPEARALVHATFGLLNSTPRIPRLPEQELRAVMTRMARAALAA